MNLKKKVEKGRIYKEFEILIQENGLEMDWFLNCGLLKRLGFGVKMDFGLSGLSREFLVVKGRIGKC